MSERLKLRAKEFIENLGPVDITPFRRGHWMAMIDLAQKPLILADPKNLYQVQVESYTRDWLEDRMRRLSEQSELPFSEGKTQDRHPAQAGLFDSRTQIMTRYLTQTLSLNLPEKDDSHVPSVSSLAPDLGMEVKTISETFGSLRSSGVLPRPNPENTGRRISIAVLRRRGNKWPVIQRYASFMYPREVLLALIEQLGEDEVKRRGLERDSIARIMTNHGLTKYKRGQLKDLPPEQRIDTLRFTHESEENRKSRVKFWLAVMDLLDKQGVEHPSTRAVWMDIWQRAASVEEGLRLVLLTVRGSKVKLTGEQVGVIEGEVVEDGITYIQVRLLTVVEKMLSVTGREEERREIGFSKDVFRFIPKAIIHKRAELISPDNPN